MDASGVGGEHFEGPASGETEPADFESQSMATSGLALRASVARPPASPPAAALSIAPGTPAEATLRPSPQSSPTPTIPADAPVMKHELAGLLDREAAPDFQAASNSKPKADDIALITAGLSHDLNNLLVGVLGNVELAQAAYLRGEDPMSHLLSIRSAAERASALATSMMRFASDQEAAPTGVFDLSSLTEEIVMLARAGVSKAAHVVRGRGVPGRNTWPAGSSESRFPKPDADGQDPKVPLLVRGDSGKIGQVILNLIVNGADALGPKGGEVHIDIERADSLPDSMNLEPSEPAPEGFARLRVSDTGVGISPEAMPRIFQPFFSTKRQGRGLGLANSLEIIKQHAGGLKVGSRLGHGTTFEVYLPISSGVALASGHAAVHALVPEWRTSGSVLVVDDEPMVARLTAMVLEHVGLRPTIEHSGAGALERLEQSLTESQANQFRVIVVDLTMPDLSGQELATHIRRLAPSIPVVLTSGFSEQQLRQRGAFSGFDGFLQKPFRMSAMIEVLQRLLEPADEGEATPGARETLR